MTFTTTATFKHFSGTLYKLSHASTSTSTTMAVNLFLPPQSQNAKVPVLIFLSGLTCSPDNCTEKGGFQQFAAKRGLALVWPDTSPRGEDIPDDKSAWDFGTGAGFYVTATNPPYSKNYNMYDYVNTELSRALSEAYPQLDFNRVSITGHSMGGHGALISALKNPGKYKSVSAFSPIANPVNCPWGQKAFGGYLGEEAKETWKEWDTVELIKAGKADGFEALVDVGTADKFVGDGQLRIDALEKVVEEKGLKVKVNWREGYDHSYYFISSFAEEHVAYHAAKLGL